MRSEKEIKAKIEYYEKQKNMHGFKSPPWKTYDSIVNVLEWTLQEPAEEPLTTIELRELRAILAEQRKKKPVEVRQGLGQMPGTYS